MEGVRAFAVSSIRIREVNPVLSENANYRARPLAEEAVGAIGAVGAVRSLRQGQKRAARSFLLPLWSACLQLGDRLLQRRRAPRTPLRQASSFRNRG